MVTTIDIQIQNDLRRLGLYSGTASGILDAPTKKAVIEFQKRYRWLLLDGDPGVMTQEELRKAISVLDGEEQLKLFAASTPPSSLDVPTLNQRPELVKGVQRRLRGLGLYPGGLLIDGDFGPLSQTALTRFCNSIEPALVVPSPLQLQPIMAQRLLDTSQIPSVLDTAKNPISTKTTIATFHAGLQKILQSIYGKETDKLGFLDMGATDSPFKETIYHGKDFLAATNPAKVKSSSPGSLTFSDYPNIGTLPTISTSNLNFLGSDITEACLCLGNFDGGRLTTSWLGKKPLDLVECWSASKIVPILNVLCKIGDQVPADPSNLILKNQDSQANPLELPNVLIDICSYRSDSAKDQRSNGLAATLNTFELGRAKWIEKQTGNKRIVFGGKYGAEPTIAIPELRDRESNQIISSYKADVVTNGANSIAVYDLTRFISLVGWHLILPSSQRLPGISDRGIIQAVTALGTDSARYIDTALSTLGLENIVDSLVVLSKLGFGFSDPNRGGRNVTELIYTAFAQFIDKQNPSEPKLRSFALTLRTSQPGYVPKQTDTAIATAVTEIVRRIVTEDF
jgi:Putative peptidoglycan binding domain